MRRAFHTFDFPDFVCTHYNDFFVALMWPKHPLWPNNNISLDQDGLSVNVNSSLLQVCEAQNLDGKYYPCPLGPDMLQGTGSCASDIPWPQGKNHAATGWLTTESPVAPGSMIRLRFAIWDVGDAQSDSTVLIDNFRWSAEGVGGIRTTPVVP